MRVVRTEEILEEILGCGRTVLIRGGIAVVWAPYEFWIDGKTSHCGIDVFDFVKIDGAWRVANLMWTVEPDACTELRPADASAIRPAG